MKKDEIRSLAYELLETVPGNILTEDMDIDPRFSGIRLFDAPLVGFGSASDSLFAEYKKPGIIGPWHMSPEEWLPGAKSVISIFLPFTEEVRSSNRDETEHASTPWLYARIEGQAFIIKYIASSLASTLVDVTLFTILNFLFGKLGFSNELRIPLATGIARLTSSFVNFSVNRKVVFKFS